MYCPPCYDDLGKQTRDLFLKHYRFGLITVKCKTRTQNGMAFNVTGDAHQDSWKICGELETKYKYEPFHISFTEKWKTDNTLMSEISLGEGFVTCLPNFNLTLETFFEPQKGEKSAKVKSTMKKECMCLNADVNFLESGPVVHGTGVMGYCGWLIGVELEVDTGSSKLNKSNLAVGFGMCDFIFHAQVNEGTEFKGSVFQKVNDCLETGIQVGWIAGDTTTDLSVGCKYTVDPCTSFKAKVNNKREVGLAYIQRLTDYIMVALSLKIDANNFAEGEHKFGLDITLEP